MGVAFREIKSVFQTILEDWLQHSLDRQNKTPAIDDFEFAQKDPTLLDEWHVDSPGRTVTYTVRSGPAK
jgi:hypothetical protein